VTTKDGLDEEVKTNVSVDAFKLNNLHSVKSYTFRWKQTVSMHLWSCVRRQARPVPSLLVRANSCRTCGYSCRLFTRDPLLQHNITTFTKDSTRQNNGKLRLLTELITNIFVTYLTSPSKRCQYQLIQNSKKPINSAIIWSMLQNLVYISGMSFHKHHFTCLLLHKEKNR